MRGAELQVHLFENLRQGRSCIYLASSADQADKLYKALTQQAPSDMPALKRMSVTGMLTFEHCWLWIIAVQDLEPDDMVGSPHVVYWPSLELQWKALPYPQWVKERTKSLWRPSDPPSNPHVVQFEDLLHPLCEDEDEI